MIILDNFAAAKERIRELERALSHQRQRTEHERRARELAEASRDQAWRMAATIPGALTAIGKRRKMRDS